VDDQRGLAKTRQIRYTRPPSCASLRSRHGKALILKLL
jgi:hypothetical protein